VGTNVHYGPYLEYGTGKYGPKGQPYEIKPKTKKALAWKSGSVASDLATGKLLYRSAKQKAVGSDLATRKSLYRRGGGKLSTKAGGGNLVKNAGSAAMILRRKVIHPGIKPRPFLGPPFERYAPQFAADLKQIVDHLGRG
jgi:hypothetical protein